MSVEIGTATDHLDLAAKLKTFLTTDLTLVADGEEWICNRDDGVEMLFQGPGLSGTEEIFIGLKYYENVGSDLYSWDIASFTGYLSGALFDIQPGRAIAKDAFLPLWNSSIPYWFIANGQRVIVIAKVASTYQSMYLGKFLPYATQGQYPYPVFWGGMTNVVSYKYSNIACRFFPAAFNQSAYLYSPGGAIIDADSDSVSTSTNVKFQVNPYSQVYGGPATILAKLAPFNSGDTVLLPCIIETGTYTTQAEVACLGEFDGVFFAPGHGQSSETIITIDAVDYLVVQSGSETDRQNFMAVRLV